MKACERELNRQQEAAQWFVPGDVHTWRLLKTVSYTMLVTGDQALRKYLKQTTEVFSPQEFIAKTLEQK